MVFSFSAFSHHVCLTMPSKSDKQKRTMAAAAHNPAFAKKMGIPTKVAKEFNNADKKQKIRKGNARGR